MLPTLNVRNFMPTFFPTKKSLFNFYSLFFFALIVTSSWISAQPVDFFSRSGGPVIIETSGYTYGQLNKISREYSFSDAILGEVLLGHGGNNTFISLGNQPPNLVTNPWRFCFDEDRYDELEKLIGSYVVLKHKTPKRSSLLSCSGTNELVEVSPISEEQLLDITEIEGSKVTFSPEISSGVEFGRITNVISSRQFNRNYFITVQIGSSGNQFRHFVINDSKLYDFAIESLKIAAKLRLHYVDQLSRRGYYGNNIKSLIWKIEIIE